MQKSRQRAVLALSVFLIAAGLVAAHINSAPAKLVTVPERLHEDVHGDPIAVYNGYLYSRLDNRERIIRTPIDGGRATECFRLPTGKWIAERTFVGDDGLYCLEMHTKPYRVDAAKTSHTVKTFLLTSPKPGERRISMRQRYLKEKIYLRRYAWGSNLLNEVVLPKELQSGDVRIVAADPAGLYFAKQPPDSRYLIRRGNQSWDAYEPDTTLTFVPFHGAPRRLASDLALPMVVSAESTACWNRRRPFPDSQQDTVCRIHKATMKVPIDSLELITAMATEEGRVWWTGSSTGGNGSDYMSELLLGQKRPLLIEPPLRRSEWDRIQYKWIRRAGEILYLLFTIDWAEDAAREKSLQGGHTYLMPLMVSRAGTTGFWGKPVELPKDATNLLLTKTHLYFTRRENKPDLAAAVKNLFSPSAVLPPTRQVLYRMPLP